MLAVTTNPGVTVATVIAVARAALALAAPAESVATSVVVRAAVAAIVHAVQASKADPAAMIVPHALKSPAPWPCPPD